MRKLAKFVTLYEDNNATYARRVRDNVYHVIKFTDFVDACGESEAKEIGGVYGVELKEIDLDVTPQDQIDSAMQCCGQEEQPTGYALVECLSDYGCGAPLFDDIGNNRRKLMKAARQTSLEMENDYEAYEQAMNKPVNAIGSTAREFGQNDIKSAMVRGVCNDNPEAKIMAKIHGAPDEAIQACVGAIPGRTIYRIHQHKIQGIEDPLAYIAGFVDALSGRGKARVDRGSCPDDELAPAYLEGYKYAVSYKAGDVKRPEWLVQG